MYFCTSKFSRLSVYNYQGENVLVIRRSADWWSGELRADSAWRPVWLPRKGLCDIPLIASEIWYPNKEYKVGEEAAEEILNIVDVECFWPVKNLDKLVGGYLYG